MTTTGDKINRIVNESLYLQDYGNTKLIREVLQELLDRINALEALAQLRITERKH